MPSTSELPYIGRFAPSPTGDLHQGSLFAALGSYLDARSHNGRWLVRIEDLDPPREQPGATASILRCLEAHGLFWDGAIIYQSQRREAYLDTLEKLDAMGLTYPCACTRKRLQTLPVYDRKCLLNPCTSDPVSVRLKVPDDATATIRFEDLFCGAQEEDLRESTGDFIVRRKDGLFAYQLAVVVDDIEQRITHIIRGRDLLSSSARQLYLFRLLGAPEPVLGHLPLLVNSTGQKLSKQTFAAPVDNRGASKNLWLALHQLQLAPPPELRNCGCEELLNWSLSHWRRESVSGVPNIAIGN